MVYVFIVCELPHIIDVKYLRDKGLVFSFGSKCSHALDTASILLGSITPPNINNQYICCLNTDSQWY